MNLPSRDWLTDNVGFWQSYLCWVRFERGKPTDSYATQYALRRCREARVEARSRR